VDGHDVEVVVGRRISGEVAAIAAGLRAAAPGRSGLAVRAGLCIGLPLLIGLLVGHPADGAAASFGGLAGLSVPEAPFRYRARVVAAVGLGLVAAVLFGGLAAGHGLLAALVAGLVSAVASFLCQAAELPPPRELMLVMAVLAATDLTADPADAVRRAGLAAAGALLAWVIIMSPALLGRRRVPERRAVSGALTAVAELLAATGSPGAAAARYAAVQAVRRARTAVTQGGMPPGHPLVGTTVAAEALLEAALHVDVEATGPLAAGWARAVRSLRPGSTEPVEPLPADRAVVGAEQLARAITEARDAAAGTVPPADPRPPPRAWPGLGPQLAAAVHRHSVVLPAAARMGVAVAVAVGLGRAFGLGHAYWVGLTVAGVLQGSNLVVTRRRVVQRVVGTAFGVGLAFALLGWGPPLWLAVLAAALCQALVELVISTHYGLAVVGITVLALLLFHIGAPDGDVGAAIGARLLDTALGAALALLLRRLLWPRATASRLPQVQARAVAGVRRVLDTAWTQPAGDRLVHERRRLQGELSTLRAMHADAQADASSSGPPDPRWPISVAVEELSVLALSWPRHRVPPGPLDAHRFLTYLDDLAEATASGADVPAPGPSRLPGLPRTLAAAGGLADALRAASRARPGS
jgi:uncharacterized membrane protein YccC